MDGIDVVELVIVCVLFLVVTVMGFVAARWRRAEDLMHLDEWGLGGRNFGTWVTWFRLAGDLYTRVEPTLFGWPFFYWVQLAFVPLGVLATFLAHRAARRRPTADRTDRER